MSGKPKSNTKADVEFVTRCLYGIPYSDVKKLKDLIKDPCHFTKVWKASLKSFQKAEYDASFGDDKTCRCGHEYYRHFDTYDDMNPIGCKYCLCTHWEVPQKIQLRKCWTDPKPDCEECGGYGRIETFFDSYTAQTEYERCRCVRWIPKV